MENKLIAVVGMCGTGKSVVTQFLKEKEWLYHYFGGVVLEEVKNRGLICNPDNERIVREDLRKQHGMAAMAIVLSPKIEESLAKNHTILDGLYSWEEYKFLKEKFGNRLLILSVVTDKNIRYERLVKRKVRPLTKEEAYSRDISEIENLEKGGPIAIADYYVYNNGTEEDLCNKVLELIEKI